MASNDESSAKKRKLTSPMGAIGAADMKSNAKVALITGITGQVRATSRRITFELNVPAARPEG